MSDTLKDIVLDTLIDGAKLLPFLFIAFLIIELIEHKFSKKTVEVISKSDKFGPFLGGIFGALPQCGFSVFATNLYVSRIITLGTLISIYLSTSDEMIPVLLGSDVPFVSVLKIVLIKVVIGMIMGIIIDLVYRKTYDKKDFSMCEESHCDCKHSLFLSTLKHTLKTLVFILLITFGLNCLFEFVPEDVIANVMKGNKVLGPLISSLVGLIPTCGASVMISTLYVKEVITLGTCIGGLLTGSGVALLVLFRNNKNIKENLIIVSLIYSIGAIIGILINLLF
jgi:hypothetical protein